MCHPLAGSRQDAEWLCLFPYQPVDQLHDGYRHTGPITAIRRRHTSPGSDADGGIWRPFADGTPGCCIGTRRLLKHVVGNHVVFEEVHENLGLNFRYSWRTSTEFGFVRTATLENVGSREIAVELVDGLQNVCPSGVSLATYRQASCLADAYKHNEYDAATRMGIYSLTAQILDRAEAAEVLQATTVWCRGLPGAVVFLSPDGLHAFYEGGTPAPDSLCTGQRGNYFVFSPLRLAPGEARSWDLVADVGRTHAQVAALRHQLADDAPLQQVLEEAIHRDHEELLRNVASADGLQATGSQLATSHHLANVLFNNMRGGVAGENYLVESHDFLAFVAGRNHAVENAERAFLYGLPERIDYTELLALA